MNGFTLPLLLKYLIPDQRKYNPCLWNGSLGLWPIIWGAAFRPMNV